MVHQRRARGRRQEDNNIRNKAAPMAVALVAIAALLQQGGEAFSPLQQLPVSRTLSGSHPSPLINNKRRNNRAQVVAQRQIRYHPSSNTQQSTPFLSSASLYFNNLKDDDVWSNTSSMWEEKVILPPAQQQVHHHHQQHHQQHATAPLEATVHSIAVSNTHDHITAVDKLVLIGATLTTALGFVGLLSAGSSGAWRYYLAGGICAATSHAVPVPVDVVKTRKQVDATLENVDFMEAARSIIKQEGVSALFLGMGPTVWGYFLEGALKFGIYEVLKPFIQNFIPTRWLAFCVSGAISGLAASVALCPMEALRIRLVAEPDFVPPGAGWVQGGLKMLRQEGVRGLCKGMVPMICKQVPYTITKNVSFDLMTRLAYAKMMQLSIQASATTSVLIPLTAAAIASVLSCISSQPGDMLLSVMNAHEGKQSTRDVAKQIWRSHEKGRGHGFFVGMNTRFMHVGIIVTLQLLIYDMVKRLCGIAATGSV